jgi:phospholipid transport system substrate-binding protein
MVKVACVSRTLRAGGLRMRCNGNRGVKHSMSTLIGTLLRQARSGWQSRLAAAVGTACAAWLALAPVPAAAADSAVKFMAKVGRELMAATRTRSPGVIAGVIKRYGDVSYIGLYSLGSYRSQLPTSERTTYYDGTARFIGRYAATYAPKYPVAKVEWANESVRGSGGIMVDSTVTLQDGSSYEVRWLLSKHGGSYRVRDAMVAGFWMTPLLKGMFEDYIAQNGGNPRALVAVLYR